MAMLLTSVLTMLLYLGTCIARDRVAMTNRRRWTLLSLIAVGMILSSLGLIKALVDLSDVLGQ